MKVNPKYSIKPKGEDVEKLHTAMQKAFDLYFLVCMYLCGTLLCRKVLYMLCMVMQAAHKPECIKGRYHKVRNANRTN